ncbi:hypothetical protein PC9H_011649 [Pleurotus ostreatus]|uniref:Heterokaryon incompatibility domain-containing protein n=1 Tax=Pleurotus ostreatus TaxID=5322 RepID=A0A8H6ZJ87_PLEOS|nr:uncharacterized protein PC9H_011649 [Pleurotus ostreatus]KAF7421129.1 hypothetical protein PC9H_011649 [Pleurotus ostreatus]
MFHKRCESCQLADEDEVGGPLCSFCKHLRLRHLSLCYRRLDQAVVPYGALEDVETRQHCPLCSLIVLAVKARDKGCKPSTQIQLSFYVPGLHSGQWTEYSGDKQGAYAMIAGSRPEVAVLSILNLTLISPVETKEALPLPIRKHISDWTTVKGRLHQCDLDHPDCKAQHTSLPTGFRVVDVKERRIVEIPEGCRYVALSYVWGPNPDPSLLLTTVSTFSSYQKIGGLDALKMPRTIEDAMQACIQLEERYLWTDRLCIIQDDPNDKMEQIQAMSGVYSSAAFVLVAVEGDHMNAGLAGMGQDRQDQKCEIIEGLMVTLVGQSYHHAVATSSWFSRSWTYQEAILAKRKLYFTSSQIQFECENQIWHEDRLSFGYGNLNKKAPEYRTPAFTMGLYGGRHVPFGEYIRHLLAYRDRRLSYSLDTYNAIAGILNALYDPNDVYFGLPLPEFDQALLWRCHPGTSPTTTLRTKVHVLNDSKSLVLPSWSWSSVIGGIYLEADDFQGSLVSWSLYSYNNPKENKVVVLAANLWSPPLSWMKTEDSWVNRRVSARVSMAWAWMSGCFELPVLEGSSWGQTSFEELDRMLTDRWPTYRDFAAEVFASQAEDDNPSPFDGLGAKSYYPHRWKTEMPPGALYGRAQVARLRVVNKLDSNVTLRVLDLDGNGIGVVSRLEPLIRTEVIPQIEGGNDIFEFIGLSVTFNTNTFIPFPPRLRHLDIGGKSLESPLAVAVLIVGRRNGYMYRVSIGRVYLQEWVNAGPTFEDVVLI